MRATRLNLPRSSGVLLHVTSLPGRGIGELGDGAYRWVDWLVGAGQSLWQILPLVPVDAGGSPYDGLSALAGNPLLVSAERLLADGLLEPADLAAEPVSVGQVDYPRVIVCKDALLRRAYQAFRSGAAPALREPFARFRADHASWLADYALFRAVREAHGGARWLDWEPPIRRREPAAVRAWTGELGEWIEDYAFRQFLFDRQWRALRDHANRCGVRIVGDLPIFVAHDSADVWAHRELFRLDDEGHPTSVAGVPPDYFSETGQRWGNPLYRWKTMESLGFPWWTERFRRALELADIVRVDHFRGFEAYWEIPAEEATALKGRWVPGPGEAIFRAVEAKLGPLPIIAEDLGLITPAVRELRERLGFPGMRVLQFAFDGDPFNPHLPDNYPVEAVAYTGTHDNDTALGWWREASPAEREGMRRLAAGCDTEINWEMIRLVMESRAQLAVVPLQDVLGLGSEARMNTPGVGPGNWTWRFDGAMLTDEAQRRLREVTRATGRLRDDDAARQQAHIPPGSPA